MFGQTEMTGERERERELGDVGSAEKELFCLHRQD